MRKTRLSGPGLLYFQGPGLRATALLDTSRVEKDKSTKIAALSVKLLATPPIPEIDLLSLRLGRTSSEDDVVASKSDSDLRSQLKTNPQKRPNLAIRHYHRSQISSLSKTSPTLDENNALQVSE